MRPNIFHPLSDFVRKIQGLHILSCIFFCDVRNPPCQLRGIFYFDVRFGMTLNRRGVRPIVYHTITLTKFIESVFPALNFLYDSFSTSNVFQMFFTDIFLQSSCDIDYIECKGVCNISIYGVMRFLKYTIRNLLRFTAL